MKKLTPLALQSIVLGGKNTKQITELLKRDEFDQHLSDHLEKTAQELLKQWNNKHAAELETNKQNVKKLQQPLKAPGQAKRRSARHRNGINIEGAKPRVGITPI